MPWIVNNKTKAPAWEVTEERAQELLSLNKRGLNGEFDYQLTEAPASVVKAVSDAPKSNNGGPNRPNQGANKRQRNA